MGEGKGESMGEGEGRGIGEGIVEGEGKSMGKGEGKGEGKSVVRINIYYTYLYIHPFILSYKCISRVSFRIQKCKCGEKV